MSYVSSHAGSAIYPGSSAPSVVLPGSNPSGVVYPSSPFPGALYPGSSASGAMYPAPTPGVVYPNVSYSSHGHAQHVAAPASYYNHHTQHAYHSVPMQHNFYGAPPVAMPSYVAPPAPAYHRSSYTVPYSVWQAPPPVV
ncbi:hypothetical protein GGU11DRAFT_742083 [Lentinula aff. detonsa]|nr:hypothetical protein GGU11DRAFT_742083 [Lentinula aff. detonsa]